MAGHCFIVARRRKTQEVTAHREVLQQGMQQFCSPFPGDVPPYTQSTWVSAEGFVFIFGLEDMEVANKKFVSGVKCEGPHGCSPAEFSLSAFKSRPVQIQLTLKIPPEVAEVDDCDEDFKVNHQDWVGATKRRVFGGWTREGGDFPLIEWLQAGVVRVGC